MFTLREYNEKLITREKEFFLGQITGMISVSSLFFLTVVYLEDKLNCYDINIHRK